MKEIILIKNGELALKGLNRSSFESTLAKNIKRRLQSLGKFKVIRSCRNVYAVHRKEVYRYLRRYFVYGNIDNVRQGVFGGIYMYSGNFFYPLSQTEIELCRILKIFFDASAVFNRPRGKRL